jgi:hypothetical protein
MFYLLLALPHVLGLAGLFAFAYYSNSNSSSDTAGETPDGGPGEDGGNQTPPREPPPGPSGGDLPLPDAAAPRRRLPVGGSLSDLHPRRLRRPHEPQQPDQVPAR